MACSAARPFVSAQGWRFPTEGGALVDDIAATDVSVSRFEVAVAEGMD